MVNISGNATVTATGGNYSAGIGGGCFGSAGVVNISGSATVTASSTHFGAGIGSGDNGDGGTIKISGNPTVTASSTYSGAGIGCGDGSDDSTQCAGLTVEISGGMVTATGGAGSTSTYSGGGAGIGGGGGYISSQYASQFGSITISGGMVIATGGTGSSYFGGGAGIGTGSPYLSYTSMKAQAMGSISITGGFVKATGGYYAAGIGGGRYSDCETEPSITGGVVIAVAGPSSDYSIGSGAGASTESDYTSSYSATDGGLIWAPNDTTSTALYLADALNAGEAMTVNDAILSGGYNLYIPSGYTLSVDSGYTFTNEDTVYVYGTLNYEGENASYGAIVNNGVIIYPGVQLPDGLYLSLGDTIKLSSSSVTLSSAYSTSYRIASGYVLLVEEGQTLTIDSNVTFTILSGGELINNGTVEVYGTLNVEGSLTGSGDTNIYDTLPLEAPQTAARVSFIASSELGFRVHASSALKVEVFDLKGALVKAQGVSAGDTEIGGLKAGAYLVRLSDGTRGMVKVR